MYDTESAIQTTKEVMAWFYAHPSNEVSALDLVRISNGSLNAQRASQILVSLAGQHKLEKYRHHDTEIFRLPLSVAQPILKSQKKPEVLPTSPKANEANNDAVEDYEAPEEIPEATRIPMVKPETVSSVISEAASYSTAWKGKLGETRAAILSVIELDPSHEFTIKEVGDIAGISPQAAGEHLFRLYLEKKLLRYKAMVAYNSKTKKLTTVYKLATFANKNTSRKNPTASDDDDLFMVAAPSRDVLRKEKAAEKKAAATVFQQNLFDCFLAAPKQTHYESEFVAKFNKSPSYTRHQLFVLLTEKKIVTTVSSKKATAYKLNPEWNTAAVQDEDDITIEQNPVETIFPVETLTPPSPEASPKVDFFLKSIRERLVENQPLNEYERAHLIDFIDKL